MKENLPHIWAIDLSVENDTLKYYRSLLSEDEKDRGSRFRFEKDCRAYTVTRACLRILLSRYLNFQSEKILFRYSKYGKPSLSFPDMDLEFNVSHARQMALIALNHGTPIGVDIEYVNFQEDLENVVDKFFSSAEISEFRRLPDAQKPEGFFNCWTRKESFIKAVGHGLSFPLKQFDVSLTPRQPATLKATYFSMEEKKLWTLRNINLPDGYVGAFAIRQKEVSCQLSFFKHV